MKPEVGQEIEITIDRLTYNGGRGIGRYNNFAVFVPDTAPGDIATVLLSQVKKNYAVGKLLKLQKTSTQRRSPECRYFDQCGGCQWQHIKYKEQITQKKLFLEKTLKTLSADSLNVTITPAPNEFFYRNRIQLHKHKNKIGYFKAQSHKLVDIEECLIARKEINKKVRELREKAKNPLPKKFEIALTTDHQLIVRNPSLPMTNTLFSQVNSDVNEILVRRVIELCDDTTYSKIYDTYCGQGNFTLPLQKKFPKTPLIGIELSRENIKLAKKKALDLEIEFVSNKVESYFKKNPAPKDSLVIIDPPRTGCNERLFKNISQAQKIIYVSCNLSTFERDSKYILKEGFVLSHLEGFDMFPQTSHLESVAVFTKI